MARRRAQDVKVDPLGASDPEPEPEPKRKPKAVTLYFDESTIARLHDAWVRAVAANPKATKSHLVEEALLKALDAGEG